MENVYRRQEFKRSRAERQSYGEKFSLKGFVAKQSMVCISILIGACFLATTPQDSFVFQKNAVKYILTHDTDIKKLPEDFKGFLNKYVFDKTAENSKGKGALLDMVMPVEGVVLSPFGMRMHPKDNVEKFHYGVDLSADEGTKILCVQKGTAKEVSENDEYGKYIIVDHGDSITSLYAHCSNILASVGDEIEAGQMIAQSGSTGNVTGPHLHLELKDGDQWLDPEEFIKFKAKDTE